MIIQDFIQTEIDTLNYIQKNNQNFSDGTISTINNTLYRLKKSLKELDELDGNNKRDITLDIRTYISRIKENT